MQKIQELINNKLQEMDEHYLDYEFDNPVINQNYKELT
jgi:hypothetical protein